MVINKFKYQFLEISNFYKRLYQKMSDNDCIKTKLFWLNFEGLIREVELKTKNEFIRKLKNQHINSSTN